MAFRILDSHVPPPIRHLPDGAVIPEPGRRGVSVVIPTHERPERLERCLTALARSDVSEIDLEVVVVDDGSTEPPTGIVADVAGRLDVRLHSQTNAGPAVARNVGARLARHPSLAFTDDDCVPEPGWAGRVTRPLLDVPTALVGGATVNGVDRIAPAASHHLVEALYRWYENHPVGAFWTSNNLACDRDAFLGVGGFDETFPLPAGEDRELGVRWTRQVGPRLGAPDAVVAHHHDMGVRGFLRQHRNYGRGAARYRDVLADAGETVDAMPPSFYATLLAEPFRHEPVWRAVPIGALVAASQVATVAGFVLERRR